jgi:hypothetical protein
MQSCNRPPNSLPLLSATPQAYGSEANIILQLQQHTTTLDEPPEGGKTQETGLNCVLKVKTFSQVKTKFAAD